MLLECICRLCLTKYENANQLFCIENKLDQALASIFNKKVKKRRRSYFPTKNHSKHVFIADSARI